MQRLRRRRPAQGTTAPHQRAVWAVYIGIVAAVLLVFTPGEGGVEVLRDVALFFGLPFFVLAFFMMYSLQRAMKEDAGELGSLKSRRWLQTLPPEEYERRMEEGDDSLVEAVVAPDYAEGTQPESAPEIEHVAQPLWWRSTASGPGRPRRWTPSRASLCSLRGIISAADALSH